MILVLQTDTFGARGGIPTYNRIVCQALAQSDQRLAGTDVRVLIANDTPADVASSGNGLTNPSLEGFGGNRFALVRRACGLAFRSPLDLVLFGHVNYAPLGLVLKRLRPKLRYGVIAYGIEAWDRLSFTKRLALGRADFVVSISKFTKERLSQINEIEASAIKLVPPSLDLDPRDSSELGARLAAPTLQAEAKGVKLLSVCRLEQGERYKGIDTVIEALPAVLTQVPQLQYFVVGSGSDLNRHKSLAREKGVAAHVNFVGSIDSDALQEHYRSCDLFVMPSAREGFGIVYLEAMRARKPVIAANSGAAPEVVKDHKTGLLVEYGNTKHLADAITSLCLDSNLRKRLGEAGYNRWQQNFTFDHFKKNLYEVILSELPASVLNRCQQEIRLAS